MRGWVAAAAFLGGCSEYGLSRPGKPEPVAEETESLPPMEIPSGEPWLVIEPATYLFPTTCAASVDLTLRNDGDTELIVDDLVYDGPPDLHLAATPTLPLSLFPGDEAQVTVDYLPAGTGDVNGVLRALSNDPRGEVEATQAVASSLSEITQKWFIEGDLPIDVVFALDKSGSMTDEMGALAAAADDFIQEIDVATTDWHIGVVSKDDGCFNNGIILPTTPDYVDVFNDAVQGMQILGTNLTEALLQLTSVALFETVSGSCNEGFARPDAVLSIILVSDEPEQSGTDWSLWVEQYRLAKSDPELVMISAVVDYNHSCGSGAAGYTEAASETGGLILDVCNSNWGVFAADLGVAAAASLRTFDLDAVPDPATITVSVDGVEYDTGWYYDALRNAVVVEVTLPVGAEVSVSYVAVSC